MRHYESGLPKQQLESRAPPILQPTPSKSAAANTPSAVAVAAKVNYYAR
jgi:hypothetical protein